MNWTAERAAQACGGRLLGDRGTRLRGVSTDSRQVARGDLFVAIRGPNFDGHDYAEQAAAAGAAALLVDREIEAPRIPCIVVDDTLRALADLARARREAFDGPVVAITGSNGKTTTKEMCAAILEAAGLRVHRTPGNLNNHIGLPLTILGLDASHEVLVAEMGMNHAGELELLSGIARPDVAGITNVSAAHLGPMGSIEAIAAAKGEIYTGLRPGGTRIVNADDPHCVAQAPGDTPAKLRFSRADAPAELHARNVQAQGDRTRFELDAPPGKIAVELPAPGLHLVEDALFAAAAALATGSLGQTPLDAIARGLAAFRGVAGRLAPVRTARGAQVLDDTYNANPRSVALALETLAALPARGRRCAVLGDMFELGPDEARLHAECGRVAAGLGIDALVAVGPLSSHTADAAREAGLACVHHDDEPEAAARRVATWLEPGDAVLVKGSRGMRMERVVAHLLERA